MTMLISTTGLTALIHTLPEREPFMLGAELATTYQTEYRRLTEAVKRNADRFPDDFAFYLTVDETQKLPQNAATSQGQRADLRPLVFTHAGAIALSGVLKTDVAAEVSVIVHRSFAAMEKRAFNQMRAMVAGLRCDLLAKKPIYGRIRLAAIEGFSIDELWRRTNYPRHKLEEAVREMVAMKLLEAPLAGMQPDLFGA